ncbi:hypothetical protein WI664_08440 [Vibrio cholerae]
MTQAAIGELVCRASPGNDKLLSREGEGVFLAGLVSLAALDGLLTGSRPHLIFDSGDLIGITEVWMRFSSTSMGSPGHPITVQVNVLDCFDVAL